MIPCCCIVLVPVLTPPSLSPSLSLPYPLAPYPTLSQEVK